MTPESVAAPPLGDGARDLAFRRLARQAHKFPELAIDNLVDDAPSTVSMNRLDLAFAHAIHDTVVRRWETLRFLIERNLTQPLAEIEPRLQATLLAGAAQLIFLDRVPAHAAINHAAQWAKERIRPGAGGFANAVLRKVAAMRTGEKRERYSWQRDELPVADGGAIVLAEPFLPEDELVAGAIATSVPPTLMVAWSEAWSVSESKRLALHTLASPPVVLNTGFAGSIGSDVPVSAHDVPGHHVFSGNREELGAFLQAHSVGTAGGGAWVQDASSSAAVWSIADLPIDSGVIIDACAGQGTKTRQLAATFPQARIVATDVDENRLATLRSVFAGVDRVKVVAPDALRRDYIRSAALVVLDVPCSNTGVLPRRPEAKYRFSPATLASLVKVQRQIIADAIPLVTDGTEGTSRGRILYSTCSIEASENEEQARWAAEWHKLAISRESRRAPSGAPGEPSRSYVDGSYSVLLD